MERGFTQGTDWVVAGRQGSHRALTGLLHGERVHTGHWLGCCMERGFTQGTGWVVAWREGSHRALTGLLHGERVHTGH